MTLVLVVDDSQFMRTVLRNTLQDYGYSVIEASNGEKAIELVEKHKPDVITMDVQMPGMDGIEATKRIMNSDNPVPILILSAYTEEGAETTLEALRCGAVDFIRKPEGKESPISVVQFDEEFIDTLEAVANADIREIKHSAPNVSTPDSRERKETQKEREKAETSVSGNTQPPTIAIGASTGGPSVIENLLADFPDDSIKPYIFITQHMPEGFTERYANRLNELSDYFVVEADDGMVVEPGMAIVTPGGKDMRVTRDAAGRVIIQLEEPESPTDTSSIDVMFKSIAETMDPPLVGVLLTGMGDDGSDSLDKMEENGAHIIAQNGETSPVFGIPRRAIQTGNVDTVLADYELVKGIVEGLNESNPNGDI